MVAAAEAPQLGFQVAAADPLDGVNASPRRR